VIAKQLLDLHSGTCKLHGDLSFIALRHLWNLEDTYVLFIYEERTQFRTVFRHTHLLPAVALHQTRTLHSTGAAPDT
jgi:hypothetical protein